MELAESLFWVFWALTLGVCVIGAVMSYLNDEEVLGFPLIACMLFAYFYVFQAFFVATTLSALLTPWMLAGAQFLALISLIVLLAGWRLGMGRRRQLEQTVQPVSDEAVDLKLLWRYGIVLTVLATAGFYAWQSAALDPTQNSAYWYLCYHFAYPGLVFCLQAMARDQKSRGWLRILLLVAVVATLMYPFIYYARRGPVFPMVIVLIYGYMLAAKVKPRKAVIVGGLLTAGLVMLTFVSIRDYSELGASWSSEHLATTLTYQTVIVSKATSEGDNEFLYHCGVIATCYQLGTYQYGTGYLSLLTSWVPRSLWPGKPALGQGWFEGARENMFKVMGWEMTGGAVPGGVADAFEEFGFLSPAFWFLIGLMTAKLYARARSKGDLRSQAIIVGVFASSHWLVAQGFSAAFVPMMIYILTPIVVFRRVTKKSQSAGLELPHARRLADRGIGV